ncbi:hypothetical protein SCHPADRAFT_404848 [Schizopora paradoxa]|uniref:Uncharacterized protein n=1 Tax=Schizopora paradoxa TaxID=27342 RepID=A0A0H2RLG8_9AGAM|nr:hypothetical protein SCHPADRAFT_404848 [Schizopora paradoxa]
MGDHELMSTYPPLLKTICNVSPLVSFAPMVLLDNESFSDGLWADDGISIQLQIQKRRVQRLTDDAQPHPATKDEDAIVLPQDLPEDIKTLSETHLAGAVILAIAADDWSALPFQLPPEYKYSVLGFYHVTNVEHIISKSNNLSKGRISTFFSWKITLQWVTGGHEPLGNSKSLKFGHPWWMSLDRFKTSQKNGPNHEEAERFSPSELNCVLVPRKVISGTHGSRTWLCDSCGKLNLCGWLGAQSCSSTVCENDIMALSYPQQPPSLSTIRSKPRSSLYNDQATIYPPDITKTAKTHEDGTHLLTYAGENVEVRHILANGIHKLEEFAERYFNQMLEEANLILTPLAELNKSSATTLIFSRLVRDCQKSQESGSPASWSGLPTASPTIREYLTGTVKSYFGTTLDYTQFTQFEAHSWMDSSTAKKYLFMDSEAMNKNIIVLCLGADIEITVGLDVQIPMTSKTKSKSVSRVSKLPEESLHLVLSHGDIVFVSGKFANICVSSVHGFSIVCAACEPLPQA